jgi:anti-sigma B factor antagonist
VTAQNAILVGHYGGFIWIRAEGKGSFLLSPALKECAEALMSADHSSLVIDLEDCSGMDSTFMGTLAGLAIRVSKNFGGNVHVVAASERNHRSLEDLGLDFLMKINEAGMPWEGHLDEVRSSLRACEVNRATAIRTRAEHILDAHRKLSGLNEANTEKFEGVLSVLQAELSRKSAGS